MLIRTPKLDSPELKILDFIGEQQISIASQLSRTGPWREMLERTERASSVQNSLLLDNLRIHDSQANLLALLGNLDGLETAQDRAFVGAKMGLDFALQLAQDSPVFLDQSLIKSLHFMVNSADQNMDSGRYRNGPVFVKMAHPSKLIHTGADWDQVPPLMKEICDFHLDSGDVPKAVSGAMLHLNVALIHPFKDSSSKVARLLHTLLLASDSLGIWQGLMEQFGASNRYYHSAQTQIGGGTWSPTSDARGWLRFVLQAQMTGLEDFRVRQASLGAIWSEISARVSAFSLPERVVGPLVHAENENILTNRVYRQVVEESKGASHRGLVSQLTASRDLAELCLAGFLVATGDKRARSYSAGPELLAVTAGLAGRFKHQALPRFF